MATASGFNSQFGASGGDSTSYETINSRAVRKQFRGVFRGKRGRRFRELLLEVTGAAAGATASASQKRVKGADPFEGGNSGAVVIETEEFINRATTSADITAIDADAARSPQPTYPTEASGNSGGGKLGY